MALISKWLIKVFNYILSLKAKTVSGKTFKIADTSNCIAEKSIKISLAQKTNFFSLFNFSSHICKYIFASIKSKWTYIKMTVIKKNFWFEKLLFKPFYFVGNKFCIRCNTFSEIWELWKVAEINIHRVMNFLRFQSSLILYNEKYFKLQSFEYETRAEKEYEGCVCRCTTEDGKYTRM